MGILKNSIRGLINGAVHRIDGLTLNEAITNYSITNGKGRARSYC